MKRFMSLVLAAMLVAGIPGAALAADTGQTTETLNITAEYSLENVPAVITYKVAGATDGSTPTNDPITFSPNPQIVGQALNELSGSGTPGGISVKFASSFGSSTSLYVTASNLTGGFSSDIPASARKFIPYGENSGLQSGAASPVLSGVVPVDASTPALLATWLDNGDTTEATVGFRPVVTLPGGALGNFSGSLTFTVVGG